MSLQFIAPGWAVQGVGALVTTAPMDDMMSVAGRAALRALVPQEPVWMHQVHGAEVIDADTTTSIVKADAAVARRKGVVCAVKIADCMPVLLAADDASVVGAAHAGWRGLAGDVLEATLQKMNTSPAKVVAWMGPAISARVYEVGEDVYAAFPGHESAFTPNRPGHWLLDLYAIARSKLEASGVTRIHGGGFCTFTERERFFSYRRDKGQKRMAAAIWLT
jgi:YfiH family protein